VKYFNALIYSQKPGIRFLRHVLFWLADIFNWMVVAVTAGAPRGEIYTFLLSLPVCMVATYFILYFLMPRFSGSALFGYIVATILVLGVFLRLYKVLFTYPITGVTFPDGYPQWSLGLLIREVFTWMGVICMAIIIKLVKNKTDLQERNDRLMVEKRQAELNFLKAQMHPHFLFNTLNTLYSETLKHPGREQEIVLNLASLLRFTLEECNKPDIPLGREIDVIRHYIELEKLRHNSRLNVSLTTPREALSQRISPLIFLPFVENSFKHALKNVRGTVQIVINIQASGNRAMLMVENDHISGNGNGQGTGIGNIRRQLELLYENNYSLHISDDDNKYRVSLSIPVK
jgi:hypothetical protein